MPITTFTTVSTPMKSMTCKELGGACNHTFHAETFEELAQQSQQHGIEMFRQQDPEHLKAMQAMQTLSQNPKALQAWMDERKRLFDELPEDA